MKLIIFAILALLALASAQRPINVKWTSCTMSGDPHFTTFDGVYHDFQGEGFFQAAKNDFINVQYQTLRCNPGAATYVTCVRRVIVELRNPSNETDISRVDWTSWPGTSIPVTIDGQNYTTASITGAAKAVRTSSGLATVSFASGQVSIVSSRGTFEVVIGGYFLAVKLPYLPGAFGNTHGTCGFFDGDASNEFTASNLTNLVPNTQAGRRYNSAAVNAFGASYAVGAGLITPLASSHHAWNLQTRTLELFDDVPAPRIPTDAETAEMQKVPFADLEAYRLARTRCEQLSGGDDLTTENCVYDSAAIVGDTTLAASNSAAVQAAQVATDALTSSSSSSNKSAIIAGTVVGCVAFVALATAFVLYVRLRKVSAAYSRALIVRQQSANNQASTKPEDNLSEHL